MRFLTFLAGFLLATCACAQSITVISPNGGEVFQGCTTQTITWADSGTSEFYSIDYSVDGGLTWTSIATFYNTTSGSYSWDIPSIQALTALIRIQDSNNAAIEDVSNNTFTLAAPRVLTSPNGGENWQGGSVQPITWVSSGTSNYSTLEYSMDAGNTWLEIDDYFNSVSGIYYWTVPNTPTTTALVRIEDYDNNCKADQSDFVFEISPATPTMDVNSPDGGELWYHGQSRGISWNTEYVTSNQLQIEYTLDDGASWVLLTPLTENDGYYSWTLPSISTTQARVRVTDLADPSTFAVSEATFTIAEPYVTILGPTGGSTFTSCEAVTVNWAHGGTVNNRFTVQYSTNDGGTWSTLVSNFIQTSQTNSNYTWDFPPVEGPVVFRVYDTSNAAVEDISDEVTFNSNPEIIVTSPNGGELWEVGTTQTITWVSAASINYVDVYYTTNDGLTWNEIDDYMSSTGSRSWTIPNITSDEVRVRVRNTQNNYCEQDASDAAFSITPPTPVITDVNPGGSANQVYYTSKSYSINWGSAYLSSEFVSIDVSYDDGATWEVLSAVTEDDGGFTFAPTTLTSTGLVRVREIGSSVEGISEFNFSVQDPFVNILSPVSGQTFTECEPMTINWEHQGTINNRFTIQYSTNGGTTWSTIASNYTQTSTSNSSYTWNIPGIEGPAIFRVYDTSNASVESISDEVTFQPNGEIFLTSPNGGELWQVGTTQTVTWVSGSNINYVDLYYSLDDGLTWYEIDDYMSSTGSRSWTIPNSPSNEVRVRVRNTQNDYCERDASDAVFAITPPTPVIEDVNPGASANQVYYTSKSYSISWNTEYTSSEFVGIDVSYDNGGTWEELAAITEDDGSYPFYPNTLTTQGLIRVREIGTSVVGLSEHPFTVEDPFINVLAPQTGDSFTECEGMTIAWEHQGTINNRFTVQYSVNGGANWSTLVSNYTQTSTSNSNYTWTYPKIEGPVIFRVYDTSNSSVESISDEVTFTPNNEIFITSPNGGELWEVGTVQTITWVSAASINYVDVYYSINDGVSWIEIDDYMSSTGSLSWVMPNVESDEVRVRVRNTQHDYCERDESDAVFSITPPTPVIEDVSPGGSANQVYYTSKSYSINWSSAYLSSEFVSIDVSYDNGATWEVLTPVTEDDSYFTFMPNTLTTTGLIRVSEIGTGVTGVSEFPFSVEDPFVNILAPTTGDSFTECEGMTINWEHQGTINNRFTIQYSTDGGSNWSTLVSNYTQTSTSNSSYTWTYPKIEGPIMFKVYDTSNSSVESISDEVSFNPNSEIFVTSPNGGELWEVGTTQTITWVSGSEINYVDVYYSLDDGVSWLEIDDYMSSTGSLNWTIPNVSSDQVRVRVRNTQHDYCERDESDAVFSITPPTPAITEVNPGGGANQTYYTSKSYSINWESAYLTSEFVSIDVSYDNGSTWEVLTAITEDDGYFTFQPTTLTTTGLMRIKELGTSVEGISEYPFSVEDPFVNVLAPLAGANFNACDQMTITWEHQGTVNNRFTVQYSTDGGANWSTLVSNYSQSSPTNSNYNWSYPNITGPVIFKVYDTSNPAVESISDEVAFVPNTDIIVNTPNGGEVWEVGTTQTITWVSTGDINYVDIYISYDDGTSWSEIDDYTFSDGNLIWLVPNILSEEARVRIRNTQNNYCEQDISDETFSIRQPDPQVLSPNGGESLYMFGSYSISWTDEFFNDTFVSLEWSPDNGLTWEEISSVETNDGSYSWTPTQESDNALIRVSSFTDPGLTDISDGPFTISPSIVVTSPNGDNDVQDWRVCTETSITWVSGGTSNYFRIRYSLDNGNTWIVLNNNYYSPGLTNTYNWVMPNTPTPAALVEVEDRYNSLQKDRSDDAFTIAPAITVSAPNGGESFAGAQDITIQWENNGATNYVNIDYSDDGGTTWNNIAFNEFAPSGTYNWTLPGTESSDYLIRVMDNVDNCKADISDNVFSIGGVIPGAISVTAPVGGEIWESCTTHLITWDASNTSGVFDLEYSLDFGSSWTGIVSDFFSPDGSYAWAIPNAVSSDVFVRVLDHFNANTLDENNLPITIDGVVANAGEDIALCLGESVFLQASGGVTYQWSPGTYLSGTETSLVLCIPLETQTYTVTVTDENGCSDTDEVNVVLAGDLCAIAGCTDPAAYNYNPEAVVDNGFCLYETGGNESCPADLSGNGFVDTADLLIILGGFSSSCD